VEISKLRQADDVTEASDKIYFIIYIF